MKWFWCFVGLFDKKPTTPVRTDIKGRLLTPDEGCGYSKVANTRIVGGSNAKVGAWPWIALLVQKKGKENLFLCGKTRSHRMNIFSHIKF